MATVIRPGFKATPPTVLQMLKVPNSPVPETSHLILQTEEHIRICKHSATVPVHSLHILQLHLELQDLQTVHWT
jgi:hypothetical protein